MGSVYREFVHCSQPRDQPSSYLFHTLLTGRSKGLGHRNSPTDHCGITVALWPYGNHFASADYIGIPGIPGAKAVSLLEPLVCDAHAISWPAAPPGVPLKADFRTSEALPSCRDCRDALSHLILKPHSRGQVRSMR